MRPGPRPRAAVLAAVALAALGLRPQLVAIGPLVPRIQADLRFSHVVGGLLTGIPLLGMGVFALATPALLRQFGTRTTVSACLGLLVVGGLVRAASPDTSVLLALTVPVGLGIGVAGTAVPVFIKEHAPDAAALATGVYTTAIQLGSTVSAAVAVPLAFTLGGWRGSLAALSIGMAASVVGWRRLTADEGHPGDAIPAAPTAADKREPPPGIDWTDPVGWWLAIIFWLTALPFYGLSAWLASAYVEHGWSEVDAGSLVAIFGVAGLPVTLATAVLADRIGSRRSFLLVLSLAFIVAGSGLVLVPALGYLWALLAGGSLGALFSIAMTLPLDVNAEPVRTSGTLAMMLCVGYTLTALTPVLLGAIRDATGSFTLSLWVNVLAVVVLIGFCLPLSPVRIAAAQARPRDPTPPRPGVVDAPGTGLSSD